MCWGLFGFICVDKKGNLLNSQSIDLVQIGMDRDLNLGEVGHHSVWQIRVLKLHCEGREGSHRQKEGGKGSILCNRVIGKWVTWMTMTKGQDVTHNTLHVTAQVSLYLFQFEPTQLIEN